MATKKQNDRATHVEIIKINARLEQVCEKLSDGMCAYKDGHSDASIADEIGCAKSSVAGIRQQLFGKLRQAAAPAADPAEIATLKATIEQQAGEIAKLHAAAKQQAAASDLLVDRFNRLLDSLAMNRAIDAKHLKVKAGQLPLLNGHAS